MPDPRDRLIVALDVSSMAEAESLLDRLEGVVSTFKVGAQLFTAAGPPATDLIQKRGGKVFLDLKYHDIPHTVAGAVREATRLGVAMLTLHASGGRAMLEAGTTAARTAAQEFKLPKPLCLAVTVLTSLDRATLQRELNVPLSVEGQVLHLAQLAKSARADGSVAAPQEIRTLRTGLGREWVIVVPGVRPGGGGAEPDDQVRVATPEVAIAAGVDYLVVGRPITAAPDPAKAAQAILEKMSSA